MNLLNLIITKLVVVGLVRVELILLTLIELIWIEINLQRALHPHLLLGVLDVLFLHAPLVDALLLVVVTCNVLELSVELFVELVEVEIVRVINCGTASNHSEIMLEVC